MKLKEKLADQSANEWYENPEKSSKYDYIYAYVAGFEKAREMAWEALGDTEYAVHPRIQSLLLNLGEEEV